MSKDIGEYNTCPHLCRYCYANASDGIVLANWTMRSGDRFVGMFPLRICRAWTETPEKARWRHVVVVHDVNLNDKYGQCIVQPYEKMCADSSVPEG